MGSDSMCIYVFVLFLLTFQINGEPTTMTLHSIPERKASLPIIDKVDPSTLSGKVMCGYQGWFTTPDDGSTLGWSHYAWDPHNFRTDLCAFDMWPDVSELDPDEKCETPFRHKDGSPAFLFSSQKRKTVLRHFKWMKEYGIDGVFLQRFGVQLKDPAILNNRNAVMSNVREGAEQSERTWAMMYDLTDLQPGEIEKYVMEDWKNLTTEKKITKDKTYLHHKGKPLVAVWGIGFDDGRKYTLDECKELLRFLKSDPVFGGNTVMVGIPTWWRELKWDAVSDKKLHDVILEADIISPWMVGRYNSPQKAREHIQNCVARDIAWCDKNGKDYLPVVFPGFSWQNLKKCYGESARLDDIPRLKGQFMWTQAVEHAKAGADMIYVAMFDEINESTAIFKCTNDPPVAQCKFITYEGLSSDHYLWLTGQISSLLRKEIPVNKIPSEPVVDTSRE
jgi:hypothetical protein